MVDTLLSPVRTRAAIEWPTVALAAATYIAWIAVTLAAGRIGIWLAIPLTGIVLAQHSSLQHEAIHGHPFRSQRLNDALLFPALGLLIPYERFRQMHLAHHHDPDLTDPHDDPESNFLDPGTWRRLPGVARAILNANNTLLGRMLLGPLLGLLCLWGRDLRAMATGAGGLWRDYALHAAGAVPVLAWLILGGTMPIWAYLLACWVALGLLRIRTFLEHRAHDNARGRSVIIEDRGPLALLFLNNNFHAVHHAHPNLPWYRLPGEYARRRDEFLRRNDGYRYASYGEVFRSHLLRRKDPVPHPLLGEARETDRAA